MLVCDLVMSDLKPLETLPSPPLDFERCLRSAMASCKWTTSQVDMMNCNYAKLTQPDTFSHSKAALVLEHNYKKQDLSIQILKKDDRQAVESLVRLSKGLGFDFYLAHISCSYPCDMDDDKDEDELIEYDLEGLFGLDGRKPDIQPISGFENNGK